jgi:hypothetical protein
MVAVCTISTFNAIQDLKTFFFTLDLFNTEKPTVYLLCDKQTSEIANTFYKGPLVITLGLDKYKSEQEISRKRLTAQNGIEYKTMWEDFMMEKATIMDIALKTEDAVFFFDSDICFMGPLPLITNAKIGVSPHMIKPIDEERYGKYNAGFLWTSDKRVPNIWREASKTSRFYDQAALEDVVSFFNKDEIHYFPIQNNYGWWRMFQGTESPDVLKSKWTIFRNEQVPSVGLRVEGKPLNSVHTHWGEKRDPVTKTFNLWLLQQILKISNHPKAASFARFIVREFKLQ